MENATVCVVGGPQLQNRLLCSYLTEALGLACSAVSHQQFCRLGDGPGLVLVDYQDARREVVLAELFVAGSRADVALFNVPAGTDLVALIAEPQLLGVFYDHAPEALLARGIAAMLEGELWLPRKQMANYLLEARKYRRTIARPCSEPLTQREWQVLDMMCNGARNVTIAAELGVSPHTVKTHISNIFKKIDASTRLEAVNWARAQAGE